MSGLSRQSSCACRINMVLASHGGAGFLVAVGALRSKSAKVLSKMEAPKCLNPNQKHIHWPREGPHPGYSMELLETANTSTRANPRMRQSVR